MIMSDGQMWDVLAPPLRLGEGGEGEGRREGGVRRRGPEKHARNMSWTR